MSELSASVEMALAECGRERVYHNEVQNRVAILWSTRKVPPNDQWILGDGEDLNKAGEAAAREFSKRIREEGERLVAWAKRIDGRLKVGVGK